MSATETLTPAQVQGVDWLIDHPLGYLADPPGFGKTRQLLLAAEALDVDHIWVVCPAAIRDARVWQTEATRIELKTPLTVVSYHQCARKPLDVGPNDALLCDEAVWLQNRKVTWGKTIEKAARTVRVAWLASGTPFTGGDASRLWGQLRMLRDDLPAYWTWVGRWFTVTSTEHTNYHVSGTLLACAANECPASAKLTQDCEHWQRFAAANYGPLMLRRPESEIDLPDMVGADTMLLTPMVPDQARMYREMVEGLVATLPEAGITLEALTRSAAFVALMQLASGVAAAEPDADWCLSGKMTLLRELLQDAERPVVVAVWYRNTAKMVARLLDDLGVTYGVFGADTSAKERASVVERFQRGELQVLLGSIATISEGITLTAADQVVMVERSWRPDTNTQMIRRVQRRGQQNTVTVRQLVTPGTVDVGQWRTLNDKADYDTRALSRVEVATLLQAKV